MMVIVDRSTVQRHPEVTEDRDGENRISAGSQTVRWLLEGRGLIPARVDQRGRHPIRPGPHEAGQGPDLQSTEKHRDPVPLVLQPRF